MNQIESELTIKTSKAIAYWFIVPALLISGVVVKLALQEWYLWFILPFFLYGLWLGFQLLISPKTLIEVIDDELWLYEGSFIHESKPKIKIPFELIDSFDLQMFRDNRGASWFLTIVLKKPVELSQAAQKSIANSTRFAKLKLEPTFIPWCVNWPEGGAKKLKPILEQKIQLTS